MYQIAICDDNQTICNQIENILLDYQKKSNTKIETYVFLSGDELISHLNKGSVFDLIYLDIEMSGMSGVEVGNHIRKVLKEMRTEIVYVSGTSQYDRDLFDVQPMNFIAKPIHSPDIINSLLLAFKRSDVNKSVFRFQKRSDVFRVPIEDILYFESKKRKMDVVTTKGNHTFHATVKEVLGKLPCTHFIQISRSTIVNYHHVAISKFDKTVLSNGEQLSITATFQHTFRSFELDHID